MIVLDTSALLKRYVDEEGTHAVLDRMVRDRTWAASALALPECEVSLCHLSLDEFDEAQARRRLRSDWERFIVVPVDGSCLHRATEIGCMHRVRTLDAVHLAAADRLPPPFEFLTYDGQQASAARAMGMVVAEVLEA